MAVGIAAGGLLTVLLFFLTIATLFDRIKALEQRCATLEQAEGISVHNVGVRR